MVYLIYKQDKSVNGRISLPASKSISNRVLIINALCDNHYPVRNLSDSDDTRILKDALLLKHNKINVGHAGTVMRFLTAFLSIMRGEWEITGSARMKQRPIGILVDALNQLGGRINYLEKKGFPPLKMSGSNLTGKVIKLDGSISSQYISALLIIAPVIHNGLVIKLKGNITSSSYIKLTLSLMSKFGIKYKWSGNTIIVAQQYYHPIEFTVESDWSGASYWYQILALSEKGNILLKNLQLNSLQGDAQLACWFEQFGIISMQKKEGILISKTKDLQPKYLHLDFIETPDIAQTMATLCVVKKIPFYFTGLKTLKIKETDRIAALKNELTKFGAQLTEPYNGELEWNGKVNPSRIDNIPSIKTYNDHRMAMSFAPIAITGQKIEIQDPMVVTKSYPNFWNDIQTVGFEIIKST